jgi:type I restriction enzyme S subunit
MAEVRLPEGWAQLKIGDIADVVAGGTPKANNPENFSEPGTDIAWLTPADLSGYSQKYISHGARDLSKTGYRSSSAKLMPKGSLLFSSRAPIGYVAIAANEISTNQGFKNFVFTEQIDPSFAYYYFRSIRDLAESLGTGTTFKEVSGATAKTFPFILAPLAEQKVIADKLDTLLTWVESTKARLERIPQILKRFRQSVLVAAARGELTKDWREQNTLSGESDQVQSVLQSIQHRKLDWINENNQHNEVARVKKRVGAFSYENVVEEGELPDKWNWARLEDVVLMVVDCHNKTAPYENNGIALVRTSNIRDGRFIWDNLRYVSEETYQYWSKRCNPEPGDVVFTREAPMGEAAIIPPDTYICLGQRTMLFRPIEDLFSAKFLLIALMDPCFKQRSESIAVGTGVKHYRVGDVSELSVPVPPVDEQTEIVRRVEQLFAYADTIEQQVQNALARVNNLTQSILVKAFRGELTEQWRKDNPDLISGDNSAEALLEKIKAELEEP